MSSGYSSSSTTPLLRGGGLSTTGKRTVSRFKATENDYKKLKTQNYLFWVMVASGRLRVSVRCNLKASPWGLGGLKSDTPPS